ncbi:hypothetical protein CcrC1_gp422 [Caulobacter phage C1]|nr:hypothetical protein CcrC1_gp422 [Caulobacter phage C1]UTU08651.1 hypothetical protein CcrC2_gp423 [Caulobacter phage C2]UTU10283.1 hypothetical protein CcrRB23_gp421 [Caulobacter phage RB23]UXY92609.1 hypothetical protein CcrJ4_gp417 [Caulobacter phage J4]WGN97317.1 hypothetical protein [Bertelyvirus sp.]
MTDQELLDLIFDLENELGNDGRLNALFTVMLSGFGHRATWCADIRVSSTNPGKIVSTYHNEGRKTTYGTSWPPEWTRRPDYTMEAFKALYPGAVMTVTFDPSGHDPDFPLGVYSATAHVGETYTSLAKTMGKAICAVLAETLRGHGPWTKS